MLVISAKRDFVYNAGNNEGLNPFDHSGVHRTAIEVIADHIVGFSLVGDIARYLARMR